MKSYRKPQKITVSNALILACHRICKKSHLMEELTMVFEKIAALIADRTDCAVEDVKSESTFAELGIDSLDSVELLMEMEEELNVSLELEEKVETVGELVKFIESKLNA